MVASTWSTEDETADIVMVSLALDQTRKASIEATHDETVTSVVGVHHQQKSMMRSC